MRRLGIAFGSGLIITAVVVACGGADPVDVLGAPDPLANGTSSTSSSGGASSTSSTGGTSSSSSSSTSSTSSTTSSSGSLDDACAVCTAPPGCTPVIEAGCRCSFRCPDAGPIRCTWSKDDPCPTGFYCAAEGCGDGVCVAKRTNPNAARDPQCGCDGVTYWNRSIAAAAGMAIRNNNACQDQVARCGGIVATPCGAGQSCNLQVKPNQCGSLSQTGSCWQLPVQCPPASPNDGARQCGTLDDCSDQCSAIRKAQPWFEASCP